MKKSTSGKPTTTTKPQLPNSQNQKIPGNPKDSTTSQYSNLHKAMNMFSGKRTSIPPPQQLKPTEKPMPTPKSDNPKPQTSKTSEPTAEVTAPRASRRISMKPPIDYTKCYLLRQTKPVKYDKKEVIVEKGGDEPLTGNITVLDSKGFLKHCELSAIDASEMWANSRLASTPVQSQQLDDIEEEEETENSKPESVMEAERSGAASIIESSSEMSTAVDPGITNHPDVQKPPYRQVSFSGPKTSSSEMVVQVVPEISIQAVLDPAPNRSNSQNAPKTSSFLSTSANSTGPKKYRFPITDKLFGDLSDFQSSLLSSIRYEAPVKMMKEEFEYTKIGLSTTMDTSDECAEIQKAIEREKKMSMLNEEQILRFNVKKKQLESIYKNDANTFATVSRALLSKDASLELGLKTALLENLDDLLKKMMVRVDEYLGTLLD